MSSPFPGMDPYLEDAELWSDFHAEFISTIRSQLAPAVQPKYLVYIGERVYVTYEREQPLRRVRPDVAIEQSNEAFIATATAGAPTAALAEPVPAVSLLEDRHTEPRLEIRRAGTEALVTAIEVLSPANKQPAGDGRGDYLLKRGQILRSDTNLVEIDLLRGGERVPVEPLRPLPRHDYLVVIDRAADRPNCSLYPMSIQNPLPSVPIPLDPGDADATLDLQAAYTDAFARGPYAYKIDYAAHPAPPLSPDVANWADIILRQAGKR